MPFSLGYLAGALLLAGLAACASYKPLPLTRTPDLAPALSALNLRLPAAGGKGRVIDIDHPLSIGDIGRLAILNDPDLGSEGGARGLAEAALLQEGLLPNPSASLGYAAILSGSGGDTPAYTASLSEDIAALVTYRARTLAARGHVAQVDAAILWQEWQVAQKARLLALDIYWGNRRIALKARQLAFFSDEAARVSGAVTAGDLDLSALAPLLSAKAAVEQSLVSLKLERLKSRQALNALLGLEPDVRFAIASPAPIVVPADVERLMAGLPERRPDFVALRLGYRSSDQAVRAAILGQFPAVVLGVAWGSDTSAVVSAGPTVGLDLPIFNRNQGQIATARATRLLLHAQYRSRLNKVEGEVRGLMTRGARLSADLARARAAAVQACNLAKAARSAYAQGNVDQRALAEFETTALERQSREAVLERGLDENRMMLTMELGLGLPQTSLTSVAKEVTP